MGDWIFVGGDFSEIDVINDGTVANFTNFGRVGGGELSLARLFDCPLVRVMVLALLLREARRV